MFFQRILFVIFSFVFLNITHADPEQFQPTHDSVSTHKIPEWYDDAKFGIMIHYGLYSVPAWAPLFNPVGKVFSPEFFIQNPYSAWYMNTMQIKDSPTYQYHLQTYGANFKYDDFVPLFNQASRNWQPDAWSNLFEQSGAKYVVFVTKHHDGFLLWPSEYRNPYKPNYVAERDIVGELTKSVRNHHMRMGLYYSGGYDWSWKEADNGQPITDLQSALAKIPQTQAYSDYVDHQWHELIKKYHPDLLWNDIALPQKVDKFKLFADYYNSTPDGVFNNRWAQTLDFSALGQPDDWLVDLQLTWDWFDYYSPEYLPNYKLTQHRWEADHGPGYAFAYNRNEYEHPEHFENIDQLIGDLADVVSKNGNLLLAIGPEADGTIPDIEKNLLIGMGDWLDQNGEAIYSTRPWTTAEGNAVTTSGKNIELRFTRNKDNKAFYAIVLDNPQGQDITIQNLVLSKNAKVAVLHGKDSIPVQWYQVNNDVQVMLSKQAGVPTQHPLALRITPVV